jgi:hypothetical protein
MEGFRTFMELESAPPPEGPLLPGLNLPDIFRPRFPGWPSMSSSQIWRSPVEYGW